MKHKRRLSFALAPLAVAVAAFVGGVASPPSANADPVSASSGSGVTVPLNTPFATDGGTYTFTSASTKPDVDNMIRFDLGITAQSTDDTKTLYFQSSKFRLRAGTDTYAPVSCSCKWPAALSTENGTVSFVLPDKTTAATFIFLFDPAPKEVPITFATSSTPAESGSLGGDGVTVPLNTPFSSGEGSYTITAASAKPDVDGKIRLDLGLKAQSTDDTSTLYFQSSKFRLTAGSETYAPDSCSCEWPAALSTQKGTVSFVVPKNTTKATFVIEFQDGSKSVPVTLSPGGGTGSSSPQKRSSDDGEVTSKPAGDPTDFPAEDPTEKKSLAAPTIDLEAILAGVAVNITDHSGVASNCTYTAPLVFRDFKLPANGTATVKIVPLAKLGIPYPISIACDNGAKLDTTAVW
jgi:hypothetical protein